jgi:hypothetical protein
MLQTAANTIAAEAKGLGALETHADPGGVVIRFAAHDERAREIGYICLDVTADVVNLSDVRVANSPAGTAWYQDVARKVHAIDQTRARVC